MEHLVLGEIPREATVLENLQHNVPSVRDVRLTRGGTCRYHDPSSNRGISAKMGFDATKPIRTEPFAFKRIHVNGVENIKLDNILQQDAKTAFAQIIG